MNSFSSSGQYRRWSIEQKLRILREYEALRMKEMRDGIRGGVTKFLKKYGIASAHLNQWMKYVKRKGLSVNGT